MTIHPEELADAGKPINLLPMWLRLANMFDAIVLIPAADSYVEQVPIGVSGRSDVKSGSSLIQFTVGEILQSLNWWTLIGVIS